MVRRYHFLKRNDIVLDLGAAPGGWLQAARQVVGRDGYVVGIDKNPIAPLQYNNVTTLTADITQSDPSGLIQSSGRSRFDVIISDLSPNVSGVWEVDHARQIELAKTAFRIAHSFLKPAGNFLVKVFQGSELKEFEIEMKSSFQTMRIVKPPASRSESAELFFLGLGFTDSKD